jgi:hypothetical protein
MKDNREPAPKKIRSISSWNTFQTEWFKKNSMFNRYIEIMDLINQKIFILKQLSNYLNLEIKVTTPGVQKQCAEEYALLDKAQLDSFKNRAEELSKNRFNKEPKLIESISLRKAELNKQIYEIRKLVCILLDYLLKYKIL